MIMKVKRVKYNILIVEDQEDISSIVSKYLEKEGYISTIAKDGFEALEFFSNKVFHLIILDIMMPGIDGFEVLSEIRKISDIPIIMLTAKQDEVDRIKGFDIGADDYIVKPFSVRELVKRVKVIFHRIYHETDEIIFTYKNIQLYTKSMKLFKDSLEIPITTIEYQLLFTLFKNKGQILTREQLINLSFTPDYNGYDRNIDTYIKRIRKKIESNPKHPTLLVTKYGSGYVFGGDN